jgi:hypothetical protein
VIVGRLARRSLALGTSVVALILGLSGVASAAAVSTDQPCYRDGAAQITASGLAPNDLADYDLWINGSDYGSIPTDGNGNASFTHYVDRSSSPPILNEALQVRQGSVVVATSSFLVTPLAVLPDIVGYTNPTGRIQLRAYGFIGSGKLYAHYARNGRLYKTVAVGSLSSPCGTLGTSVAKFPFRPVPAGSWRIQFDGQVRYRKLDAINAPFPLVAQVTTVEKTIGGTNCGRRRHRGCSRH